MRSSFIIHRKYQSFIEIRNFCKRSKFPLKCLLVFYRICDLNVLCVAFFVSNYKIHFQIICLANPNPVCGALVQDKLYSLINDLCRRTILCQAMHFLNQCPPDSTFPGLPNAVFPLYHIGLLCKKGMIQQECQYILILFYYQFFFHWKLKHLE